MGVARNGGREARDAEEGKGGGGKLPRVDDLKAGTVFRARIVNVDDYRVVMLAPPDVPQRDAWPC